MVLLRLKELLITLRRSQRFLYVDDTAPKRSAVAVIIRSTTDSSRKSTLDSDFEVLFIKRAIQPNDPWSGNVAFPGGRRQLDDQSDIQTAIREAKEEVGVCLSNPDHYKYCGALDQRDVFGNGKKVGLVVCPFVFLQTSADVPSLKLNPHEVSAACWTKADDLIASKANLRGVELKYLGDSDFVPILGKFPSWFLSLTSLDSLYFPGISLQSERIYPDVSTTTGFIEMNLWAAASIFSLPEKPLYTDKVDDPMKQIDSELNKCYRETMAWPPFQVNNEFVNLFLKWYGYRKYYALSTINKPFQSSIFKAKRTQYEKLFTQKINSKL